MSARLCLVLALVFLLNPVAAFAQAADVPGEPPANEYNVSEGTHVVDAGALSNIAALTVAQGATAVINFSNTANLSVLGNIANSGSIYAYSSNSAISAANFSAQNIYNNQGAVLSTVLPASIMSSLTNVNANLGLNLSAINNIVNAGTISSAGVLGMAAGGSITNTGIMQAMQAVNLSTASLVNAGTIASLTSNVNIASMISQNLMVNNAHGSIQALLGNVNVSTSPQGIEKLLLSVLGGDVRAQALNLLNPNGAVEVNVRGLDGTVNVEACSAHITASTQTLTLGNLNLTGDPTFYNTGGDVIIASDIDLRPVNFTAPGAVALAIVAYGNITAAPGVTKIDISTVPNNINSLNWPGDQNAGNLLILAGAPNFNATPTDDSAISWSAGAPPVSPPYPGDSTNTLTIYNAPPTGQSAAIGGNINMANVNINTQAGYPGLTATSGNVELVAMSGLSNSGNISIGNITTGESTPTAADNTGLNGNVLIIAAGNVTTGTINTSGNTTSPSIYNGNVTIASAGVKFLQSTLTTSSFVPAYAQITQTIVPAGTNSFTVNNTAGMSAGQTIYLDPQGPSSETVVINNINGSTITLNNPLVNAHVVTENIYMDAQASSQPGNPLQIVINPGAGTVPSTPMTQNGGDFAPDLANIGSGTITTGTITAGSDVTITTTGSVNINGNISQTQNPTQIPSAYLRYPTINVSGSSVTVGSGVTVSSEIANCTLCFNGVNITTNSLTNSGTIQGFVVNIFSPTGQGVSVANNGTITGGATNGGASINAFVNFQGYGGLALSGSGTIQTPGVVSVIEIAAGDGQTLAISGTQNITTGTQGLLILNAQRANGVLNIANNTTLTFAGSPTVIINTPTLNLGNGSTITGPSVLAIGSGLALSAADGVTPVNMFINLGASATATITATNIAMRPMDGATITLQADGGGATLNINGTTQITAQTIADIQIESTLTINFNGSYQRLGNPSGGITGIAFQPYVGPYIDTNGYTNYAAYSYQQVLALLGPIAASQQFQAVSTYTDGIQPPPYSSTVSVIQAAKEIGLKVSAGIFITMDNSGAVTSAVDANGYPVDLVPTLNAAARYGNVMDIVMGNEDIVGGANPENSIAALTTLISNAQTLRSTITNPITGSNYTSTTMPVTTRQVGGVYDIVTWGSKTPPNPTAAANMVALLNQVDGYVYGNFYPFFNNDVIAALTCQTCTGYAYNYIGMNATQAQFSELIETNMTAQYSQVANDVQTAGVTNKIRIGETGWAQSGISQASPTYANYYYQAMQDWSSKNGVPINDYFDGYNEPWKPTDKGPPGGGTITLSQATNIGDTQIFVSNPASLIGVGQIVIYPPPQRVTASTPPPYIAVAPPEEFVNIQPQSGGNNPWQLFTGLQYAHNIGDIVNVGQGSEPYFGNFVANGTSPGGPGYAPAVTYQLNSITQQVNMPLYLPTALPPTTSVAQQEAQDKSSQLSSFLVTQISIGIINDLNNDATISARLGGTMIPTDQNPERLDHSMPTPPNPQFMHGDNTKFNLALSTNKVFYGAEDNNGHIALTSGNGLFAAKSNLNIQTKMGSVKVDPGAVVMVLQNQHGTMVFNLYDERSSSVHIDTGNGVTHLAPGKQIFLTDKNYDSLEEISPSEIGYRNSKEGRVGDLRSFKAEFSMFSALSSVPGLRSLVNSPDKADQKLLNKLLVAAAAYSVLDKEKTPFNSPSGHGTRKVSY